MKKPKILVVDDDERNLKVVSAMLAPLEYDVILARDGIEALEMVEKEKPDVILLDIMMPKMDGFEVLKILKENEETKIIPVVMVTALKEVEDRAKALELGADDFLTKPVEKLELRARVKSLINVKRYYDHMRNYQKELEEEVEKRTLELKEAYKKLKRASLDTIYRLARAAEYKDEDTGAHIQRVSHFAEIVARKMGMDENFCENILYSAPMHDIGKIGIPDHILLKPGKLTPEEWEIMKKHTIIGAKILEGSDVEFIKMAEIIALTHHERWDGKGYPKGLKGEEIPLPGRITAIADVFDALCSKRPYKPAYPIDEVLKIIKEEEGKHFDPKVVSAFFSGIDEILDIKERFKNEGESLLLKMVRGEI